MIPAALSFPPFREIPIRERALFPFAVPFRVPLASGGRLLTAKRGLLLRLRDDRGNTGWGEAAPLDGYSPDSLDAVNQSLENNCRDAPPSLLFALETALIELCERRQQIPFPRLAPASADAETPVSALIGEADLQTPGGAEGAIRKLLDQGFRVFKLKVGRGRPEADARRASAILALLKRRAPDAKLRLDANGAWSFEQALAFAQQTDAPAFEFIEEPLRPPGGFARLYRETGLKCALDESLQGVEPAAEAIPEGTAAVVLKPMTLGGAGRCLDWMDAARQRGVQAVVSSCYEAGPGFRMLVRLAVSAGDLSPAHGLDTLKYFDWDGFYRTPPAHEPPANGGETARP